MAAFDGETKCGKTTVTNAVASRAEQHSTVLSAMPESAGGLGEADHRALGSIALQAPTTFEHILTVSAGSMFRAATFYALRRMAQGQEVQSFTQDDVHRLRDLLAQDGMDDLLQNDPDIGKQVSSVAKLPGAQALCGALFSDAVVEAYYRDDKANLVIVDARDPVATLRRHKVLGRGGAQVDPANILPVYIDTPILSAARRMGGDLQEKIAEVTQRRHLDATRREFPVTRPTNLVYGYADWLKQFSAAGRSSEVAAPYCFNNGEGVSTEHIARFSDAIVAAAKTVALNAGR